MAKLVGEGHQILALFNIDYHQTLQEITEELMSNPTKQFRLTVKEIKKKKS